MTHPSPGIPLAGLAALYADAAYEGINTFIKWVDATPGDYFRFLEITAGPLDVQAYIHARHRDKLLVVAIRGSEPHKWDDWRQNLNAGAVLAGRGIGKVHGGFLTEASAIAKDVAAAITEHPDYKVLFTGHSKGGSICAILQHVLNTDAICHTFGACRSMGWRAAGLFDLTHREHYRWVNTIDPVPKLLWWGYKHVGRLIYIDGAGGWSYGYARPWDRFRVRLRNPFGGISRHSMTKYRKLVSKEI